MPPRKEQSLRQSSNMTNPYRITPEKVSSTRTRDRATIKRVKMYGERIKHDKYGNVTSVKFNSSDPGKKVARIEPNAKWFGNTRVVGQKELDKFRVDITQSQNPHTVILNASKVPFGLLNNPFKNARMQLLTTESFKDTFGNKSKRKRPKLSNVDLDSMLSNVETTQSAYDPTKDSNFKGELAPADHLHAMFKKGQSNRIWSELYKVLDCSDVVIQVLDARDPLGTRCTHVEEYLKKHARHKNLILILNKCDLVPTWVTRRWVNIFSKQYPTIAFHASITNPFGKGSLIQLLKQLGTLHSDKRQISVGFIGYPNVGKSSIINTLKKERVCKAAPVPGETKVWQYVTLFRRVFLIDSPGVVYDIGDNEVNTVLKGVVRIEKLIEPANYIDEVLLRVKTDHIINTYGISEWKDTEDFLTQIAKKAGRLVKGGEADIQTVARRILHDWQRGKIPWFVAPPEKDEPDAVVNVKTTDELKNEATAPQITQMFSKIEVVPELADETTMEEEEDTNVTDWDKVYEDGVNSDEDIDGNKDEDVNDDADEDEKEEAEVEDTAADLETEEPVNGKRKASSSEPAVKKRKSSAEVIADKKIEVTLGAKKLARKKLKKLKQKKVLEATPKREDFVHNRVAAAPPNTKESIGDIEFRTKKNVKDLSKLGTERHRPNKGGGGKTNEKTQKRYSMNRRLTRLCA